MKDKGICFKFLVENKTDNAGVMAEHGLSIYIETDEKKILFDGGATELCIANARKMGVALEDVDVAVVSHGHYDHTGGIPAFCMINEKAKVYIHKNAFRKSYGFENGKPETQTSGITWSESEKMAIDERLNLTDGPVYITRNIAVTGNYAIAEGTDITENFYYKDEAGNWVLDDMSHEQCLVINEEEGLYIFSGCSHKGVISALEAGKAMFPGKRVAAFVAGMHLYSASYEDRKNVVERIASENLDKVIPVHCTGIRAICDLKAKLGDACIVATCGDVYYGREI